MARHSFAVYKLMAQLFGADTVEVPDPGYTADLDTMLTAITPKTRAVFIANPNNPTGTMVGQEAIDRFMAKVPDHVLVVFDEAYHEFLDHAPDVLPYVRAGRNVVVMRTFSKIMGLANLRIGYGIAQPETLEPMERVRLPANVNAVGMAAAVAALGDRAHVERTVALTVAGRRRLIEACGRLGLTCVPSQANFVLVADRDEWPEAPAAAGIAVRPGSTLGPPGWHRVTIGTPAQMDRVIEVLERLFA